MHTKIKRWGNSPGIRIPRQLLDAVHLKIGDAVAVLADEGQIVVRPAHPNRGRYRLEDLLADYPDNAAPNEQYWGTPLGKEVW